MWARPVWEQRLTSSITTALEASFCFFLGSWSLSVEAALLHNLAVAPAASARKWGAAQLQQGDRLGVFGLTFLSLVINEEGLVFSKRTSSFNFESCSGQFSSRLPSLLGIPEAGERRPHSSVFAECWCRNCQPILNDVLCIILFTGIDVRLMLWGWNYCLTSDSTSRLHEVVVQMRHNEEGWASSGREDEACVRTAFSLPRSGTTQGIESLSLDHSVFVMNADNMTNRKLHFLTRSFRPVGVFLNKSMMVWNVIIKDLLSVYQNPHKCIQVCCSSTYLLNPLPHTLFGESWNSIYNILRVFVFFSWFGAKWTLVYLIKGRCKLVGLDGDVRAFSSAFPSLMSDWCCS